MWTFFAHSSLTIIISFLTLIDGASTSSDSTANLEGNLSAVDSLIRHVREELRIPGMAVGIVVDGRTVFASGYGLRNHDEDERGSRVSNRTLFAIGSCTKAFTTYLLERLVNVDRSLAWNDLVHSRVPEFRLNDVVASRRIKIKDLITHVSGLPAHDLVWAYSSSTNLSTDELLARISHLQPNYDLREKYQYNNLMYVVASLVIERTTGQSWKNAVRRRIFQPLNMTRSFCSIRDVRRKRVEDVASPHSVPVFVESPNHLSIVSISWTDISVVGPAASIISSAEDMTKWIEMQLELYQTSNEMHTPHVVIRNSNPAGGQNFGYGFGWGTAFYHGRYMVGHSGLTDGFSSRVTLFPDEKLGVVVLANLNSLLFELRNLTCRIADMLADHVSTADATSNVEWVSELAKFRAESLASSVRRVGEDAKEKRRLVHRHPEEYLGHYVNAGYGIVEVVLDDESRSLFASYDHDRLRFTLEPDEGRGRDSFNAWSKFPREAYHECSFARDSSGNVIGCRFDFEPLVSPIFFEKKFGGDFRTAQFEQDVSGKNEPIVRRVSMDENEKSLVKNGAWKDFEEL